MRDYKVGSRESKQTYLRRRRKSLMSRREKRTRTLKGVKGLLALCVAGALLYIAAMGVKAMFRSSFFDIARVEYEGQSRLPYEELTRLSGLEQGVNIFSVDLAQTCRRIGTSPWVREVTVRRALPSRLRVEIEERVPVALIKANGELYLAAPDGVILGPASDADRGAFLRIGGIAIHEGRAEPDAGAKVVAALELADFLKGRSFPGPEDDVEVRVDDPSNVVLMINDVEVRLGRGGYEEKFKRLSEVESDIRRRQIELAYIDLRFADKVVVKPAHEEEAGAETVIKKETRNPKRHG